MRAVIVVAVVTLAGVARAAPAADVVVYWAPPGAAPALADAARDASRAAGAAFVDRRAELAAPADPTPLIARGRAAYDALRFEDAVAALDEAAGLADAGGGRGLDRAALAELFLTRGLAWIQRGDADRAWDDLVTAARVDPSRVLDPARFPPRAVEALARAQAAIAAAPRARLAIAAPPGCAIRVDGVAEAAGALEVGVGPHWLHATCAEAAGWGRRVEVGPGGAAVEIPAAPAPTDDDVLIQARATGARAAIAIAADATAIRLRRLAADGRELDRRTVAAGDAAALTSALTALLTPPRPAARWYRSRWLWAAGGAAAVAAVLVPVLLTGDSGDRRVVVRPTGLPW